MCVLNCFLLSSLPCFPAFVGIKPHIAVYINIAGYRTSTDRIAIRIKLSRGRSLRRRHCNSQEGCRFQHIQVHISRTSYNNEPDQRSMFEVCRIAHRIAHKIISNVTYRAEYILKSSDCTATSHGDTWGG